jgi:tetratricopeptide (TPR) repeat protein
MSIDVSFQFRISLNRLCRIALGAGLALAAAAGGAQAQSAKPALKAEAARAKASSNDAAAYADYLAGRLAQLDHDWKTAGQRMRRAWEADRDDPELRHDALLLSIAGDDFSGAIEIARTVPADSGDASLAGFVLILDDLAQQRYAAATAKLSSRPQSGIERYVDPVLIAWAEAGRGNGANAMAAIGKLDGLEGVGEMKALQTAMLTDALGEHAKAAELYDKMLEGAPSAHALIKAAYFYLRQGNPAQAKAAIERLEPDGGSSSLRIEMLARLADKGRAPPASDATSGAADSLFELAAWLNEQKQTDIAALLYVRFALHLQPNYPSGQLLLAEIDRRWGRYEDGVASLVSVDPKSDLKSTADRLAMDMADKAGDAEAALKLGRESVKAHPEDIDLGLAYADLLREKSHFPEAIAAYDAVLPRIGDTSNRRGIVLYHRGIAYQQAHQWPKAETDLLEALKLRPDDPGVLNYLAFSWADQGINLDRARTMLERAVQLLPDDGAIIDSLGWVMFRAGDYDDAVKQLEHAVSLDTGDAVINDHLGDAYWRAGRQIEARSQWEKASHLTDDKSLGDQIRAKLRNGLEASATPRRASAD